MKLYLGRIAITYFFQMNLSFFHSTLIYVTKSV